MMILRSFRLNSGAIEMTFFMLLSFWRSAIQEKGYINRYIPFLVSLNGAYLASVANLFNISSFLVIWLCLGIFEREPSSMLRPKLRN